MEVGRVKSAGETMPGCHRPIGQSIRGWPGHRKRSFFVKFATKSSIPGSVRLAKDKVAQGNGIRNSRKPEGSGDIVQEFGQRGYQSAETSSRTRLVLSRGSHRASHPNSISVGPFYQSATSSSLFQDPGSSFEIQTTGAPSSPRTAPKLPREIESGRERPSNLKSSKSPAATRRPTAASPAKPNSPSLPVLPVYLSYPHRDPPHPRGCFYLIVALRSRCHAERSRRLLHVWCLITAAMRLRFCEPYTRLMWRRRMSCGSIMHIPRRLFLYGTWWNPRFLGVCLGLLIHRCTSVH